MKKKNENDALAWIKKIRMSARMKKRQVINHRSRMDEKNQNECENEEKAGDQSSLSLSFSLLFLCPCQDYAAHVPAHWAFQA